MHRSFASSLALFLAFASFSIHANAQEAPANSGVTLKATSNLVVVDVVVTDGHHNPVHDLHASDFNLEENGAAQHIRNFEEHRYTASAKPIAMPTLAPGVFTNYSPLPTDGPLNILLVDTLNTPMQDQSYLHSQLLKFIKTAHPNQRMAIFGLTNTRLILLQGFTADPELIRAAVNKKSIDASPLLDNPLTGREGEKTSDTLLQHTDPRFIDPRLIAMMKQSEAEDVSLKLDMRAKYTLKAMSQLGRYLSNLPGRKNLIWFSGSFPISILPEPPASPGNEIDNIHNPFAVVRNSDEQFRETVNLLSRSQVAVYPVDARGLAELNTYDNDLSHGPHIGRRSARADSDDQSKSFSNLVAENSTMNQMAQQTGGKAFTNTNGLAEAVSDAITSGANYYTLTYTPSNNNYNGNFRKIQVKLQQKGLSLSYRRGYYADDPAHTDHDQNKPLPTSASTVSLAMMYGTPEPAEIVFKTRILPATPASAPPEATLITGTLVGPNASLSHGPYRSYLIDIGAIARTISFTSTSDGHRHAAVELLTIAFNKDGAAITSTANSVHMDLPPDAYAQLLRSGLQVHQQISVPAKGDYYLRIGLHDLTSNHVGAVELPLNSIKNLPPDTVSQAAPTTAAPPPSK